MVVSRRGNGPEAYATFTDFAGSTIGLLALFGWTVAFFYHFSNGIRHLIWDAGYLFKLKNAYAAGYFVFFSTIVLSFLTWYYIIEKTEVFS